MSRQSFTGADVAQFPSGSNPAVNTTTSATNLWNPAIHTPIPALDMLAHKAYILRAGGIISNTATPTIIFNVRVGQSATPGSNVNLGATVTFTTPSGLSATPWWAEFVMGVRSIGVVASTATVVGTGLIVIGGVATTVSSALAVGDQVPTTVDNTVAQGLVIDCTWGTNSASNTITARWQLLQSLN